MTSPAGSIGIGVTLDAGDLDTQITKAVQSSMVDALAQVKKGLGNVEGAFGGLDLSKFTAAVDAQSQQAAAKLSGNLDTAGKKAGQSISTPIQKAAADATAAINKVDGSGLKRVSSASDSAAAGVGKLKGAFDEVDDKAGKAGKSSEDAASRAGEAFGTAAGKLGGFAVGLTGIAGIAATIGETIERQGIGNKLQAQLDLTKDQAAQAGKIAGDLYGKNYGDSFEGASDAVGAVLSSKLTDLGATGANSVDEVTKAALTLSSTFGTDVAESTQTVKQLITNGLVPDAKTGFDLLGASFQKVPAAMRDELPELINEYGTFFKSVGFSGQEAFGALVAASDQGKIAMDKVGDAVKEFGIRATDIGDKNAQSAITSLGLNATETASELLKGGDTAKVAFQKIVSGLSDIKDPAQQAAAATALFGTPLEDLDKSKIPGFLNGLNHAGDSMKGFEGTAKEMGDALNQGPAAALETFKRGVQTAVIETLGSAVSYFKENATQAKILGTAILVLAGAYVAFRTAASIGSVIQGVSTAMKGLELATTASATAARAQTVTLGIQKVAMIAGSVATGVATAATWAFNAALAVLTSPITAVIAAIALIIGALVLFFTKTEIGQKIFQVLKDAVVTAFQAILTAIGAAWAFIQPIFAAIFDFVGNVLVGAFNVLSGIISTVWGVISGIISTVWTGVIQPIFSAIVGYIVDTIIPNFQKLGADIAEAWNAWTSIISAVWTNVVQPVFNAIVGFITGVLGPAFVALWQNVIAPAFGFIGDIISGAWNNVISPILSALKFFITDILAPAIMFLWQNVIAPAFDTIGGIISGTWTNVIQPAFEGLKTGLGAVGDFFGTVVGGIGRVWDGLKGLLAKPINFMIGTVYNNGIRKAWNVIEKFIPGLDAAPEVPLIPEHRKGGPISGPGGRDNVLMWGDAGEHMLTVQEVLKAGGHNAVYALREMISKGIPFSWNNGKITPTDGVGGFSAGSKPIQDLGMSVAQHNPKLAPQGLFAAFRPRGYKTGGEIEPWMLQLESGHKFAKSVSGTPYIAGSNFPTGGDCSGYMSAIANVILGGTGMGGAGHWSTVAFPAGQGDNVNAGGQLWVAGLAGNTLSIGMNGGPNSGGANGHTRGTLGAIPLLGIGAVDVEDGGGTGGGATYGGRAEGAAGMPGAYHIPIGPNGFFQAGNGSSGPSPEEQRGFLEKKVSEAFDGILNPIKGGIAAAIGSPPPAYRNIPPSFLDTAKDTVVHGAFKAIGGLGNLLGGAWTKAKDLTGQVLHSANPLNWFDNGGIANGVGFMPKNTISPERVLSPEQTKLFEALVAALTALSSGGGQAAGSIVDAIGSAVGSSVGDLMKALAPVVPKREAKAAVDDVSLKPLAQAIDTQGAIISDTSSEAQRTQSSQAQVQALQLQALQDQMTQVANQLTGGVLGPVMQSAVQAGVGVVKDYLAATTKETVSAQQDTTAAVDKLGNKIESQKETPAFGLPGSAFDLTKSLSDAVVSISNAASSSILAVGEDIAKKALEQRTDPIDNPKGKLGDDKNSGGFLVDTIIKLTGVEIQIRDSMNGLAADIRKSRGDDFKAFDENGAILSDTASLLERTASSQDQVIAEQNRINRELLKSVLRFIMTNIVIPVMIAIMTALITIATTAIAAAIGAAIGSIIPGLGTAIGGAIGAAVGAAVGVALSAAAAAAIAGVGVGAGAAIDAFDSGGVAHGTGFMPKNTISPERVLSPKQTSSFDKLVSILDARGLGGLSGGGTKRTVQIGSMTIHGQDAAEKTADNLLSLLN